MLVRRGVLCGIIKGRVRFQCELCYEDITDLTREEKEEHLHIRHGDANWRRENHIVAGIQTDSVSKKDGNMYHKRQLQVLQLGFDS